MVTKPLDPKKAIRFVKMVSRLTKDGETVCGKEFVLENDDAVDTLHSLISEARKMLGRED